MYLFWFLYGAPSGKARRARDKNTVMTTRIQTPIMALLTLAVCSCSLSRYTSMPRALTQTLKQSQPERTSEASGPLTHLNCGTKTVSARPHDLFALFSRSKAEDTRSGCKVCKLVLATPTPTILIILRFHCFFLFYIALRLRGNGTVRNSAINK